MEVLRRILVLLGMLDGVLHVRGNPTLTFEPEMGIIRQTIHIACNLTGYDLPNMELSLNGRDVYVCGLAGLDCAHREGLSDYSKVHWIQTSMGIATISNLNKSRDAGQWICTVLTDESEPTFLWVKADCGNLTVDKGDVSYINDTLDQSSAKFNCKSGYQLNGNSTRTCLADGTWSGISPLCTAIFNTTSNRDHGLNTTGPSVNTAAPNVEMPETLKIGLISGGAMLGLTLTIIILGCWRFRNNNYPGGKQYRRTPPQTHI